ncbi:MAG: 50S ribosomal protein L24e [Candidatus Micrarchaeota archaeon]
MQCSFCRAEIGRGRGLAFVKRDGTMLHLCSRRCRQNLLVLGRNPRKLKWVRERAGERKGKPKAKEETKEKK